MHLPLSAAVAQHLDVLAEVGSTNVELVARASTGFVPHFSVVATTNQTAGKGRLGRSWVAPAGTSLAVSVLLVPGDATFDRIGWLPLLAGLAMTRAVAALVARGREPERVVALKWPNDVHVDGLKVSGLLAEFVPGAGVVVGAGLNLTMTAAQLPTTSSTSLTLVGVRDGAHDRVHDNGRDRPHAGAGEDELADAALAAYLTELSALFDGFVAHGLDAAESGLAAAIAGACSTIGQRVRVELPGGHALLGVAEGVDEFGRLVVRDPSGNLHAVAAGDITHVRHA